MIYELEATENAEYTKNDHDITEDEAGDLEEDDDDEMVLEGDEEPEGEAE